MRSFGALKLQFSSVNANGCDTDETVRMRRLACVIDSSLYVTCNKSHELAHLFNPVIAHDCHPDPLFYDCVCPTYFHVGLHQHIFMLDVIPILNVIKIQILVGAVVKVQLSFWE